MLLDPYLLSTSNVFLHLMMTPSRDIQDLCSELKKLGVDVNIDDIMKKNYSKGRLVEIRSTLQELLKLLQGGGSGEYQQQEYDSGKHEVLGHKIDVIYRCKECNQVFTVQSDVIAHASKTGHKQTIMFSRFL